MKKIVHEKHTVYELCKNPFAEGYGAFQPKILLMCFKRGAIYTFKDRMRTWRFRLSFPNRKQWFASIWTPFFHFAHDNGGSTVGGLNHYLWFQASTLNLSSK